MFTPACRAMVASAFFVASACGVTVTVTVAGLGGVGGAVYVAVLAVALPPAPCVVTTVSVPHAVELQPGLESDHVRIGLGFEPGTSVIVATIVAEAPAATLCGAATCSAKLLVMLMGAEICLEGSATL